MTLRPIPVAIGLINAMVLAVTFYTWRFSYFWLDDFGVFSWIRYQTGWQMIWYNVNPLTDFFRPFGTTFYWLFWHLFDLNPLPYHVFAWILHSANVLVLYLLLSQIVHSSYGAAVGALLFGFRANFTDIYWSFGTIFELLACLMMLLALLVYSREMKFQRRLVLTLFLYFLAVKSKEMAITLPGVLLLYDLSFRRKELDRKWVAFYSALVVAGGAFAYMKLSSMGSTSPEHPYYMDLSVLTFGRGYGWYFDHLYGLKLRWGAWMIASAILALGFAYKKENRGLFFLGYIFATLLPVVFMVNHRHEFFWYIPFFGVAGLTAVLVSAIEKGLNRYIPARAVAAIGLAGFVIFARAHYLRERRASAELVQLERSLAAEYATFINSLQQLPQPMPEETFYYKSFPRHFTKDVLMSATQVALHRTDIHVEIVETFPDPCRYCLQFEDATLMLNPHVR